MSSNNKHTQQQSRQEFQQRLYNSTSSKEHLKNMDDFDREAMEGWSQYGGSFSAMNRLDKKFGTKQKTGMWIAAAATIAIILAILPMVYFMQSDVTSPSSSTIYVEKTDVVLPDSISNLQPIPEQKIVAIATIQLPEKKHVKQEKTPTTPSKVEEISIKELPLLKKDFNVTTREIAQEQVKEIYLSQFKLIDYRLLRSSGNVQTESIVLSGVPASNENSKMIQQTETENIDISYYDYISKTMSILKDEDYKRTLARCNIILKKYPDDLNALFYAGFCNFNLGEYDKAIEHFKGSLTHQYSNFKEESEWMIAKCYEAMGAQEKANSIYKVIKDRGGFYNKMVP